MENYKRSTKQFMKSRLVRFQVHCDFENEAQNTFCVHCTLFCKNLEPNKANLLSFLALDHCEIKVALLKFNYSTVNIFESGPLPTP